MTSTPKLQLEGNQMCRSSMVCPPAQCVKLQAGPSPLVPGATVPASARRAPSGMGHAELICSVVQYNALHYVQCTGNAVRGNAERVCAVRCARCMGWHSV